MLIYCSKCNAHVDAKPVGKYTRAEGGDDESGDPGYPVECSLLRCARCDHPILVEDGPWDGPPEVLFPSVETVGAAVPKQIGEVLDEAMACMRAQAFTATVIMCRKALEGMCLASGVTERPLAAALKKMKDQGLIDSQLAQWASILRDSGNDAAHDLKTTFTIADARDVLDFTVALSEYLFTFRKKYEEFMKRRRKTKADG